MPNSENTRKNPSETRLEPVGALQVLRRAGLVSRTRGSPPSGSVKLWTDSRKITPGDGFLAYKGVAGDAHDHLEDAAARGAVFFVVEDLDRVPHGKAAVEVISGRAAWTWLAAFAQDHPEKEMRFFGVTGTNGKSSTVWILKELLANGQNPLQTCAIGTLGAYLGEERWPTSHTTPDPPAFFEMLRRAVDRGITTCVMEVSSHAIVQEKLGPIRFSGVAFTSFSRDHLDFHESMEDYWNAKQTLLTDYLVQGGTIAVADSLPRAPELHGSPSSPGSPDTWVYGPDAASRAERWGAAHYLRVEAKAGGLKQTSVGLQADVKPLTKLWEGIIPYIGGHGLDNFAAAVILGHRALGGEFPLVWKDALKPIPGRLEAINPPTEPTKGPQVVIDYAHTPDALEKALRVLRPLTKGRLVTVFGCGGDRDQGKRPQMGAVAASLSDKIFVTSDNPRTEDPETILDQIVQGLDKGSSTVRNTDRETAIHQAISEASQDDTILIAGKGHETYQIIGTTTRPFDDGEVARLALGDL